MFNSKHYVPILKWKRAEQTALKALDAKQRECITPLIQLVMPPSKQQETLEDLVAKFESQIPQLRKQIVDVWGDAPIFLDASLLFTTPLKVRSLYGILENEDGRGTLIPVVHLTDDQDIKIAAFSMARENGSGLCLRLVCSDFSDLNQLNKSIEEFILSSGLKLGDVDLLVDIKETEKDDGKYTKYLGLSQQIVDLLKWRTFTFASGSFPEDLSECRLDEENLIPRIDWKSWKVNSDAKNLNREPAFSDYTIQHPIYKPGLQFFHPTSSIKYTLENDWLIMKGKKQRFEMYLASAAELLKDKRFYGANFSDGDNFIAEKAKHFETYIKDPKVKGTGNTEAWLKAGINHHLSLVASQVSTLT